MFETLHTFELVLLLQPLGILPIRLTNECRHLHVNSTNARLSDLHQA